MIRKEPPLSRNKSYSSNAQKNSQTQATKESNLRDSYDEDLGLSKRKASYANSIVEPKDIISGDRNNAVRAGVTISIWIPAIFYMVNGVCAISAKMDFQWENFMSIYSMLSEYPTQMITVFILTPLLQPVFLFFLVSLVLFCLRIIRLGKSQNFRRGTHILISIVLSVAYLTSPEIVLPEGVVN